MSFPCSESCRVKAKVLRWSPRPRSSPATHPLHWLRPQTYPIYSCFRAGPSIWNSSSRDSPPPSRLYSMPSQWWDSPSASHHTAQSPSPVLRCHLPLCLTPSNMFCNLLLHCGHCLLYSLQKGRDHCLFCFDVSQNLGQRLAHSRPSVNIC